MFGDMTPEGLAHLLCAVEPASLKGLELLRRLQPAAGGWFPDDVDAADLVEATSEMIDYVGVCSSAGRRLAQVTPVPLTTAAVTAFAL